MLGGTLRRIVTTGLGLALFTKEKAEAVVNEFVQEGAVSRSEADRLLDAMLTRARVQGSELRNIVTEQASRLIQTAGFARNEDFQALLRRVEALENKAVAEQPTGMAGKDSVLSLQESPSDSHELKDESHP